MAFKGLKGLPKPPKEPLPRYVPPFFPPYSPPYSPVILPDESNWISFYPWDANFIVNCADQLGVDILDIRTDSHKNRLYFVWRTK